MDRVYAIPLVIGHNTKDPTLRRRDADGQKEPESETSLDKRNSASNYQSLMMQVDLGSSDMVSGWIRRLALDTVGRSVPSRHAVMVVLGANQRYRRGC